MYSTEFVTSQNSSDIIELINIVGYDSLVVFYVHLLN